MQFLFIFAGDVRAVKEGISGKGDRETYIMARRTSPIGMTPSFSPSMGSEKSANASLISASSSAVMSFSLASLDGLVFVPAPPPAPDAPVLVAAPPGLRFAGCHILSEG